MKQKMFFSYSRDDANFALKLATDLKNAGIDLWIDQLDIPPGKRWDTEVEKSLESSGSLLVILSETSVLSNNVLDEVSLALENNKQIYPVLIDTCKIPFRLKRLQHIDFTEDYADGLNHLLKALNSGASPGADSPVQVGETDVGDKQHVAYNEGILQHRKEQGKLFTFLNKNLKVLLQIFVSIIAFGIMSRSYPVFQPRSLYHDQSFTLFSKLVLAGILALSIVLCHFLNTKKNVWAWWVLAFLALVTGILLNISYNNYQGKMVINTGAYGYGRLVKGNDYIPEVKKIRESYKQSDNSYPTDADLIAGFGGNHLKVWPVSQVLSNSNYIVFMYSCMLLCFILFLILFIQGVFFLFQKQKTRIT